MVWFCYLAKSLKRHEPIEIIENRLNPIQYTISNSQTCTLYMRKAKSMGKMSRIVTVSLGYNSNSDEYDLYMSLREHRLKEYALVISI